MYRSVVARTHDEGEPDSALVPRQVTERGADARRSWAREAILPIKDKYLETLDGCSTMRQDATHVRED